MIFVIKLSVLMIGALFACVSFSKALDNSLEMLAGLPKPPFIIEENGDGLQLELIRHAFASVDQQVQFTHLPLGRNVTSLKSLAHDGVVTIPPTYQHPSMFVSEPYISYQNVVVSLQESQFNIESINDLVGKDIIAFQNAKKFLGPSYRAGVAKAMSYREVADQEQQINMLFSHRTEVIILDLSIFRYFLRTHQGGRYAQFYNIHTIFEQQDYAAGFSSKQHRDLFDRGIARIKEDGLYQEILDRYQ